MGTNEPQSKGRGWLAGLLSGFWGLTRFLVATGLFMAVMVVGSYALVVHFIRGEQIETPNLIEPPMSLVEAMEHLRTYRLSLTLEQNQPHETVPEGHIISQVPTPGSLIKAGTPIRVVVSKGPPLVGVPDLRGETKIAAGIRLRRLGLDVGRVSRVKAEDMPGGSVLATDPPGMTGVLQGTRVNLLVASGSDEMKRMPRLEGLTLEEAGQLLGQFGITQIEISEAPSTLVLPGQIHDQHPAPGQPVDPQTRVRLTYLPLESGREDGPGAIIPPIDQDRPGNWPMPGGVVDLP